MGYVLQSGGTAHKKVRYYSGYYSGGDNVALDVVSFFFRFLGSRSETTRRQRKQVEPIKTNPPVWLRGKKGNEGKQVAVFHTVTHGR